MGPLTEIVAAATRMLTKKSGGGGGRGSGNSALAWDMWATVPEVGAYADWISNAMSGATLFAGIRNEDGDIVDVDQGSRAAELVSAIAGGPDGQSMMLADFGTQLAVTGDAWLVIFPDGESDNFADDRWVVLSTEEVSVQRGKIKVIIDGEELEIPEYDPEATQSADDPFYLRVWKQSPRRRDQATSPVVRSLVILEELRLLNAAVAAVARSRVTGRGVLLVPSGARFPTTPGQDQAEDSLLDTFIEVASTAIREPESAAATVPIVLEIPGDLINGVKWLEFSSDFDAMAIQLRDEAIRRFATGADVPAEILLGLGDASHWGAWAITAEALRMGAEPRLALVCQALTSEWLQPLLEAEGDPDASRIVVWYDTSGLRASSNKGASALEAFKEGLISDEAARRELGFTENDAPAAAATVAKVPATVNEGTDLPVEETNAPPSMPALAATSAVLDSFTADTSAALAEAVDGLVWTALAVAGRKLINTPIVPRPSRTAARALVASAGVHLKYQVRPEHVSGYHLLDDAWDRVPAVAQRYGMNSTTLAAGLDSYVRALLTTGQAHEFDNVPRLLAQIKVGA